MQFFKKHLFFVLFAINSAWGMETEQPRIDEEYKTKIKKLVFSQQIQPSPLQVGFSLAPEPTLRMSFAWGDGNRHPEPFDIVSTLAKLGALANDAENLVRKVDACIITLLLDANDEKQDNQNLESNAESLPVFQPAPENNAWRTRIWSATKITAGTIGILAFGAATMFANDVLNAHNTTNVLYHKIRREIRLCPVPVLKQLLQDQALNMLPAVRRALQDELASRQSS